ncbi:MAG: PfkB family carbohydrate kinase [Terriglobales bacterium]
MISPPCPAALTLHPAAECRWDLVALGEVMLRFDPGPRRVWTARSFEVSEGGGEYNVARGLRRCFGLRTAVVTALADNPVGRLVEDLMLQGGVDLSLLRWTPYDGVGRAARNGLNFTERGFGLRPALGCSDRGHTAISQLQPGQVDWDAVFAPGSRGGARWFHTGGVFAALSDSTAAVAAEAMRAARRHGVVVSYDLNYRDSLWRAHGGQARAQAVNRSLAPLVQVMLGNEEDFTAALGVPGWDDARGQANPETCRAILSAAAGEFGFPVVATTLRTAHSATRNDWGAICLCDGHWYEAEVRPALEVYDRVGGGDSFASGLIYGFLSAQSPQWAVECGAAHGALAMTTPGDTSMATLEEVTRAMRGVSARIAR